jgi:Ser/Thr protein kinase RdoA (MazF antagonist)
MPSAPEDGDVIGAKIGAGREADVHAWGDDAAVKLYRPGFGGHRAEAAVLATLDGRGIAPRLIEIVERDGRTGLVLERLAGQDMLRLLQRQPWRVLGLARALAEAHLAVHAVRVPGGLPDVREVLATRIEDAGLPARTRDFAVRILDGLPGGDRVCHGDYHPGNVLVAADRVSVIDWVGAACGVPEADHARTLLLLRRADPLPGTPALSRALMTAGRSVFAYGYTRAYTAGSPRPLQQVNAWLLVQTAARLSEGIAMERPMLLGLLDRARNRAASGTSRAAG